MWPFPLPGVQSGLGKSIKLLLSDASSYWPEKSFDEERINQASATNTCFTSNWCCGQNIWHRPMKFWHKKRQT